MEFKDIKEFIESNKESNEEIKAYLQGFKSVSVDEVSKLVNEKEELKKWFDSERDKHFSKGLETWKTNNLEKLISEEVAKRNPSETPQEKRIRELEEMFKNMENEKTRESLKNKALTVANEKKIPTNIIEFFIGQDEQSTISNLGVFEEAMQSYIKSQVDERLKGSYTPPGGGSDFLGKNPWKKETFNLTEQAKILKENPELAKQLKAQA